MRFRKEILLKILDFFRKKNIEKVSDNEIVMGILEHEQEKKDKMNTISEVEKPFGEELPESARKTPAKSKKKELPPDRKSVV